jgi:hypothetical protein
MSTRFTGLWRHSAQDTDARSPVDVEPIVTSRTEAAIRQTAALSQEPAPGTSAWPAHGTLAGLFLYLGPLSNISQNRLR